MMGTTVVRVTLWKSLSRIWWHAYVLLTVLVFHPSGAPLARESSSRIDRELYGSARRASLRGRYEDCLDLIRAAEVAGRDLPDWALFSQGRSFAGLGRFDEARKSFEMLLARDLGSVGAFEAREWIDYTRILEARNGIAGATESETPSVPLWPAELRDAPTWIPLDADFLRSRQFKSSTAVLYIHPEIRSATIGPELTDCVAFAVEELSIRGFPRRTHPFKVYLKPDGWGCHTLLCDTIIYCWPELAQSRLTLPYALCRSYIGRDPWTDRNLHTAISSAMCFDLEGGIEMRNQSREKAKARLAGGLSVRDVYPWNVVGPFHMEVPAAYCEFLIATFGESILWEAYYHIGDAYTEVFGMPEGELLKEFDMWLRE